MNAPGRLDESIFGSSRFSGFDGFDRRGQATMGRRHGRWDGAYPRPIEGRMNRFTQS